MEGLFKKVMMHAYEVASCSIIRLPEAESAPSPSVQAENFLVYLMSQNYIMSRLLMERVLQHLIFPEPRFM